MIAASDRRLLGRVALAHCEQVRALAWDGGAARLAYTAGDVAARHWFAERATAIGLVVEHDAFGNYYAWSPGAATEPAVLLGSHLDSVEAGGAYDGVLGVAVGLAVVEAVLAEHADAAIGVVGFACEESTRFGIGALGSRLAVGELPESDLDRLVDPDGLTLRDVLAAAGYVEGAVPMALRRERVRCFLEVHVDQGDELLERRVVAAVVRAIAGATRLRVRFLGDSAHAGAHARRRRRDALVAASRFVCALDDEWGQMPPDEACAVTVGRIDVRPNSPNTVAGEAVVVADLRGEDEHVLARLVASAERLAAMSAAAANVAVETTSLGTIESVRCNATIVRTLLAASRAVAGHEETVVSLAGHDAMVLGRTVPSAMVFVANPAGVSHTPDESVDPEGVAVAAALVRLAVVSLAVGSRA